MGRSVISPPSCLLYVWLVKSRTVSVVMLFAEYDDDSMNVDHTKQSR